MCHTEAEEGQGTALGCASAPRPHQHVQVNQGVSPASAQQHHDGHNKLGVPG